MTVDKLKDLLVLILDEAAGDGPDNQKKVELLLEGLIEKVDREGIDGKS